MGLGIKEKLGHFKGDKVILILVAALACFSILLVSSTEGMGVFTHIIHLIVAAIAATVAYFLDYKNVLHKGRGCILLIAIGLLGATLASSAVRGISIRGHSSKHSTSLVYWLLFGFPTSLADVLTTEKRSSPKGL